MKKFSFSHEVLSLFFIISIAVLFGKILVDVKEAFGSEFNDNNKNQVLEYLPYSHTEKSKRIETIKDLTVIRDYNELNYFIGVIQNVGIDVNWLNTKLEGYGEDFFEDKTLAVISIVNDNNVTLTKINDVYKNNGEIIIEINKVTKDTESTGKYTWFAIIEIEDLGSEVKLDIKKT